MDAGKYNIVARQGATFNLSFTISTDGVAWDLSTYTARMQVRPFAASSTKYLDLVSPTNITLSALGVCTITVSASAMSAVPAASHVYDIEFESAGGEVYPILSGKFVVRQEVTV